MERNAFTTGSSRALNNIVNSIMPGYYMLKKRGSVREYPLCTGLTLISLLKKAFRSVVYARDLPK